MEMIKIKKNLLRFLSASLTIAVSLSAFFVSPVVAETPEKPLLTIACLSDLHNQNELITSENPTIRGTIADTLTAMKREEESIDAILIGGDVTSDNYTSQAKIESILGQIMAYTDPITPNTLWVSGNHDYNAGEGDEKYNSADYYDDCMKERVGELPAENAYYESYQGQDCLLAYHYVIKGFDFVCLNTSPADMAGDKQNSNYTYTAGALSWLSAKLASIGPEKTVFFLAHFPLNDSNSLSAAGKGLLPAATEAMKNILKNYPNLIYLYGHDHGGNAAYLKEDTAQRVTVYDTDGNKVGGGIPAEPVDTALSDALVWKFIESGGNYRLQNLSTGKYLGVSGNLNTVADPVDWIPGGSDGTFTLTKAGGTDGVHYSTSSGTYSFGALTDLSFYEKVRNGETVIYTKAKTVKAGGEYVIVADGTRALTNKISPENSQRMAAMDVIANSGGMEAPDSGVWTAGKTAEGPYTFLSDGSQNYLGYDGNLYIQPAAAYSTASRMQWAAQPGTAAGTFHFVNQYKSDQGSSDGVHYGGSGYSVGSLTDCVLYKGTESGGTITWTQVASLSELTDGVKVMITDNTSQKVLTAVSNNAAGADRRLVPADMGVSGGTIESVPQVPDDDEPPQKFTESFITSFMGSMRYYNNDIDGWVNASNSKAVQALMIYVYYDRIVLQMKNYGTQSGGSWNLAPYVISRTIAHTVIGDLNEDGIADASDIVTLRTLIKAGSWTEEQLSAGDLDGDENLTDDDTSLLLAQLNIVSGDVSKDGKLTALDIMSMRKAMLGSNPTDEQLAAGDLDGDGTLAPLDIMIIRKKLME